MAREFQPRTPERLQQTIQLVERAMSIDENDSESHRIMCRIALMQGQYAKSEYHLERALALNPNDPRLVVQRGINLTFLGDPQAAIPWIERAMRIDPFSAHRCYLDMARALFMAERPAEAIAVLERTARAHWEHYLWLAASRAAASEESEAQQAGREATALRPNLSITTYMDGSAWKRSEDEATQRAGASWAATMIARLIVLINGETRPPCTDVCVTLERPHDFSASSNAFAPFYIERVEAFAEPAVERSGPTCKEVNGVAPASQSSTAS